MPCNVRLVDTLEPPVVLDYLSEKLAHSRQCLMAVAYGSHYAYRDLEGELTKFLRNDGELRVLLDTQSLYTSPDLIEEFATVPGDSRCKIFVGAPVAEVSRSRTFHPKMFFFSGDEGCEFLVGSANFTRGGFGANIEIGVAVSCQAHDGFAIQAYDLWKRLWNHENTLLPSDSFLAKYRELHRRYLTRVAGVEEEVSNELGAIIAEEAGVVASGGGVGLAYLLGLVCGGAIFAENRFSNRFEIRYESGERRPEGAPAGIIAAPGISDYATDQREAMRTDAQRIQSYLGDWLEASNQGSVALEQRNAFSYTIWVTLSEGSSALAEISRIVAEGTISGNRFYPSALPALIRDSDDSEFKVGFFRGYFDIRGRVSEADRVAMAGPLRIQFSISPNAEIFGQQLYETIIQEFKLERPNYLKGARRGRESMIRLEAQEVPTQLFTSAWQSILHADFARYNIQHFGRTNSFQGRVDFEP